MCHKCLRCCHRASLAGSMMTFGNKMYQSWTTLGKRAWTTTSSSNRKFRKLTLSLRGGCQSKLSSACARGALQLLCLQFSASKTFLEFWSQKSHMRSLLNSQSLRLFYLRTSSWLRKFLCWAGGHFYLNYQCFNIRTLQQLLYRLKYAYEELWLRFCLQE